MFDLRPLVLLGDNSEIRSKCFIQLLESEFSAEVQLVKTWEDLMVLLKASLARHNPDGSPVPRPRLILFADDLHNSPIAPWPEPLPQRFHEMAGAGRGTSIHLGCLGNVTRENLLGVHIDPLVLTMLDWRFFADYEARLMRELNRALRPAPPKPSVELEERPGIPLNLDNDTSGLGLQVRFLTEDRTIHAGKDLLSTIVREFFRPDRVIVRPLSQGLSGATVFWVVPQNKGVSVGDFALKLAPASELRKIRHEITGHENAGKTLQEAERRFYFPDIVLPEIRRDEHDHVVHCKSWCAICYRLLGGQNVGQFMDLETALLANDAKLQERIEGSAWAAKPISEVRQHGIRCVLGSLQKLWYQNPSRSHRAICALWLKEELAGDAEPAIFPPYGFTGKQRKAILSFLAGNALGLGPRLLANWEDLKKPLKKIVLGDDLSEFTKLNRKVSVLLSPCHGDLNGKNAMLWLDHQNHPFLIDFPSFQKLGHSLQDFARIEVEIKFAILDRHDIPEAPRAWDYTDAQMEVWKILDDHLLPPNPEVPMNILWALPNPGLSIASPELCLAFLKTLRRYAVDTQRPLPGASGPSFYEEYLPALLYHTIRIISYDSYSLFKRIFAVRSAARILAWLK